MSQSASPDIVFAQKAMAIVKAAGLDPKAIDLESFRRWAPIIFARSYSAIYKEPLMSELGEYSSREDQILNAQLVIDGLTTKTRNATLTSISGVDICDGNYRAIGILVGVLFAEGQRMWLEKAQQTQALEMQQEKKFEKERVLDDIHSNDNPDMLRQQLKELYSQSYKAGPSSPRELEKLVNRISYLEQRLRRRRHKNESGSLRNHSRSRSRGRAKSPADPPRDPLCEDHNGYDIDANDNDSGHENLSTSASAYSRNRSTAPQEQHLVQSDVPKLTKKVRPTSAPHGVRRVRHVSSRLYPANAQNAAIKPPDDIKNQKPCPPHRTQDDEDVHSQYTYDLQTGRRILLSVAQLQADERRRQAQLMGQVKELTKMEDDFMGSPRNSGQRKDSDRDVRPEYPGKRTERSVEEWLQRMRPLTPRLTERAPDLDAMLPTARTLPLYSQLEDGDLLLTVEHCHSCKSHNVSTRHDESEYVRHANESLRSISQTIFASGICVRLCVARVLAPIKDNDAVSDCEHNRIGAFEIQIAHKNGGNSVQADCLHSKLISRRWSAKSVTEKRLQSFLEKINVYRSYRDESLDGESPLRDSVSGYPIGRCQWSDTATSSSQWSFNSNAPLEFVFDSRGLSTQPKFSAGSTVYVSRVEFAPGFVEKNPLLAQVDGNMIAQGTIRKLSVRLKYCDGDLPVTVNESDCQGASEFERNGLSSKDREKEKERKRDLESGKLPLELDSLLLLAKQLGFLNFTALSSADRVTADNDVILSRSSFFRAIRQISWSVIRSLRAKGISTAAHPLSKKIADLSLAYCENTLELVFKQYGDSSGCINVTRLSKLMSQATESSSPRSAPMVDITQPTGNLTKSAVQPAVTTPFDKMESKPKSSPISVRDKSTLLRRPSLHEIDALFPRISSQFQAENKDVRESIIRMERIFLDRSTRSDDGLLLLSAAQLVMTLHELSLSEIADDGAALKSLCAYFSPSNANPLSNSIKTEELIGWLEKHIHVPSRQVTPRNAVQEESKNSVPGNLESASVIEHELQVPPVVETDKTVAEPLNVEAGNREQNQLIEQVVGNVEDTHRPVDSAVIEPSIEAMATKTFEVDNPLVNNTNGAQHSAPDQNDEEDGANEADELKPLVLSRPTIARPSLLATQSSFHNKDLVVSSIVLEGSVLAHSNYDTIFARLMFDGKFYDASVCLARERGSKRRSFNVNWPEILVTVKSFQNDNCKLALLVSDEKLAETVSSLPLPSTFDPEGQNSVAIPMSEFSSPSFEIKSFVVLPVFGETKDVPKDIKEKIDPGSVSVTIHGHAHEAREARQSRIMSMKPVELLNLKFEPLPVDDDYSGSDSDEEAGELDPGAVRRKGRDGGNDLDSSLFPTPSLHNLLSPL